MKFTDSNERPVKLEMTSMIDIVFQLLIFFIMTFSVAALEADFSIRMPQQEGAATIPSLDPLPDQCVVRIQADPQGQPQQVSLDNQLLNSDNPFQELNELIDRKLAAYQDPETSAETFVEFQIDASLEYRYTIQAVEAVSGRLRADGTIKPLIQKMQFATQRL